MPLKDLAAYLGNRRASGTLKMEREDVRKQAVIREGLVINTGSSQRREYLGQFLINMGHLTEDQFNRAFQTQHETKVFLGKILVMIGLVSEEVVINALSLKNRETMLEAFNWTDGTFVFDTSSPPPQLEGLESKVDLLDICREAEFREAAWQAIHGAFPHGKLRLELIERNLPEPPRPGSLDARLVAMIHEGLTIDDMILALHATDFFLYQRLYALYRLDAVKAAEEKAEAPETDMPTEPGFGLPEARSSFGDPDEEVEVEESKASEEPGSPEELTERAQLYLATGRPQQAEMLARKALELSPSPEREELARKAEAALFTALKEGLLEQRRVPVLLVPAAKLKSMELTAPERYLLSRVDGMRDVSAIVHVSPLQELEALKLFQRFIDSGLIRLI